MPCIAHGPDRYLASPRLHGNGVDAEISLRAWLGDREALLIYALDSEGRTTGEAREQPLPDIDVTADRQSTDGDERVVARWVGGQSSILLQRDGNEVLVFRAEAIATAPTLLATPEGTWVAFHHNLREDTVAQDVAKWIAIRFIDRGGQVLEPVAPMLGLDRDAAGEEQSFEFPVLVAGPNGAITLVGRGSHNYWRQDLDDSGFGHRQSLTDGIWGSRGRRASAIGVRGGLLIAFRGKLGIEVIGQPAPQGAAPILRAAVVDHTARTLAVRMPSWNRHRDPAKRHGLHTYFGDLQQHSAHSDGLGTADEAYLRARYCYGDDFVALTDHESFLGKRTSPSEWNFLQDVADSHNEAGSFATLLAYEWTGKMHPGPGHKCVYLPNRGLPIVSRDDVANGRELVRRIQEQGAFAAPHHIGWTGCDEAGHTPEGQPVWEICSCHGCYEEADSPLGSRGENVDQFAGPMLRKGHRFGFVASSDSHGLLWHHGECRKRDPYRTGLTAVQARALDRNSILEALRSRRCYATSGAKIVLDFFSGDFPMGSVVSGAHSLNIEAHVTGTAALASVELVTPAGVAAIGDLDGDEGRLQTSVEAAYCYLRVTQEDGEMAWSSPIWRE